MTAEPLIKQFLKHQSAFMGYLIAMTRSLDAAEEVFQNVAVVMQKKEGEIQPRDFRAWAKEVVRRQALLYLDDQIRTRVRERTTDPALLNAISRTFEGDPISEEEERLESDALHICLERLTTKARRMIAMRYQEKSSFDAIADVFRTTAAAVQRSLSRARATLRECIARHLKAAEA
jgi:RNA polymerase sigma-70 factor (ECF subfamily)